MMMSDDARSDFVLAAAGAALLPMIEGLVAEIWLYGTLPALVRSVLHLVWIGASLMLVPWLISRHREQGSAAWDLKGDRTAVRKGTIIALPIVALGVLRTYSLVGGTSAALGQLALPLGGDPTISGFDLQELLLRYGRVAVVAVGSIVFVGFLINRARDAFREVEIPLVEALRTFGTGAVGVALITGVLLTLRDDLTFTFVLSAAAALLVTILLADRLVFSAMTVGRSAIIGPAIVTVALHILATGGPLQGNLLLGLWWGALGFGLMVVVASLAGTGATKLAWVMPVLATAIWPSCMSAASYSQIGGGFCGF